MAAIPSYYNFDTALLTQFTNIQRRVDYGISMGTLSALNSF